MSRRGLRASRRVFRASRRGLASHGESSACRGESSASGGEVSAPHGRSPRLTERSPRLAESLPRVTERSPRLRERLRCLAERLLSRDEGRPSTSVHLQRLPAGIRSLSIWRYPERAGGRSPSRGASTTGAPTDRIGASKWSSSLRTPSAGGQSPTTDVHPRL